MFLTEVRQTGLCVWKVKKARNLKSEKSFPAWHIEHSKPSHAMRQQNKTETEKENRSPWTRQYSDDVFIEDPLPAIKPRWEFNLIKNKFLKILCFSAFEWFSGLWMFKCRSRADVGWVGGLRGTDKISFDQCVDFVFACVGMIFLLLWYDWPKKLSGKKDVTGQQNWLGKKGMTG